MDLATLFFHSPMHTRKEKKAIGRLREARTQSFFLGISVVDDTFNSKQTVVEHQSVSSPFTPSATFSFYFLDLQL